MPRLPGESGYLILSNGERRLESPAIPRVALKASSLLLLKRITALERFYVSYNLLIYLSGFHW